MHVGFNSAFRLVSTPLRFTKLSDIRRSDMSSLYGGMLVCNRRWEVGLVFDYALQSLTTCTC